jgi:hypothetical protein
MGRSRMRLRPSFRAENKLRFVLTASTCNRGRMAPKNFLFLAISVKMGSVFNLSLYACATLH